MSWVTNAMVSFCVLERAAKEALLAASIDGQQFRSLTDPPADDVWGGSKFVEADIVGAAFNYVTDDQILETVWAIDWAHPGELQVFIKGEDDDVFRVYGPRALKGTE